MSENQPGCKVPIGTAYQKPLPRDQTYEESFWQTQLLQEKIQKRREWRGNIIGALAWAALVVCMILLTP